MQDLGGTTMSAGLLNAHGVLLKVLFGDPGAKVKGLVKRGFLVESPNGGG